MPLDACFDRIRIISLRERKDRRREVVSELARIGVSLDPGKVDFFDAVKPDGPEGFPSIGARGCFLSHLGVYREAIREGVQSLLVLEDDVLFRKRLLPGDDAMVRLLASEPWHILYLGHFVDIPANDTLKLVPHEGGVQCLHCYALRGEILPFLVAYLEAMLRRPPGDANGGPMHVDGAVSWFRKDHPQFVTRLCSPSLAVQRSSRSDIATHSIIEQYAIGRFALGNVRRLRNNLLGR